MIEDPFFEIVLSSALRNTLSETCVDMVRARDALAEVRMIAMDDAARRYHVRLGLALRQPFRRP